MKLLLLLLTMVCYVVGIHAITVTDSIFDRNKIENFAFGADVSFVPQMESWGTTWLDKNGKKGDILQILKEQGINNIRLRVWTVASGPSSKQEVVSMCKRAKAKGMGVMIDFHYSDTWADPGSQTIPSAWTDHSVEALAKNVYDHTFDVLSAIKAAGVTPKWVQVGNETKRGMLYPVGQTNKGGAVAFAKFVKSGYDAVKAVDSTMQVIVHLPEGHDNSLYRSIFDGLKKNGAKWDIIGLSAYPRWSHLDGPTMITKVMSNINDLKTRYNTPCMIVETGHYPNKAVEGNQYLVGVMDRMIKNGDLGCFYWEPESMGGYDMGAWDNDTKRPTVMMDAFLGIKHTEVSWLMKAKMQSPTIEQTIETGNFEMLTKIQHQRKGKIKSVEYYLDKKTLGTYKVEDPSSIGTTATIPFEVTDAGIGMHTAWVIAKDNAGNIQPSDTVTFFVGESVTYDDGILENPEQLGGTIHWKFLHAKAGNYRLVLKYSSIFFRGTDLKLNGNSLKKIYFNVRTNDFKTIDIEIPETGYQELTLTANSSSSLPDIASLRIFPLDGQDLPIIDNVTGIDTTCETNDEIIEVYSLSGVFLYRSTSSESGIWLGDKSSAVVVLPKCVGGTPYIVRKQRLK